MSSTHAASISLPRWGRVGVGASARVGWRLLQALIPAFPQGGNAQAPIPAFLQGGNAQAPIPTFPQGGKERTAGRAVPRSW